MDNHKDQAAGELFDQIQKSIFALDDNDKLSPMDATEVVFDVLEQMLARVISSCSEDDANLAELTQQSTDNIQEMAQEFFAQADQED